MNMKIAVTKTYWMFITRDEGDDTITIEAIRDYPSGTIISKTFAAADLVAGDTALTTSLITAELAVTILLKCAHLPAAHHELDKIKALLDEHWPAAESK